MRFVIIFTETDGTQTVVGVFRTRETAQKYVDKFDYDGSGVNAQITPLEKP